MGEDINRNSKRTRLSLNVTLNSFNADDNTTIMNNNFRLSSKSSKNQILKQNQTTEINSGNQINKFGQLNDITKNQIENKNLNQIPNRRRFTVLSSNPQRFELKLTNNFKNEINSNINYLNNLDEMKKIDSHSVVEKGVSAKIIIEW